MHECFDTYSSFVFQAAKNDDDNKKKLLSADSDGKVDFAGLFENITATVCHVVYASCMALC